MNLKNYIRDVQDFPKPGIVFKDITPLLASPEAFTAVLSQMAEIVKKQGVDRIVGIESRGFLFGAPLAAALQIPFIPIRKPGKLPSKVRSVEYALEYGSGTLDIHEDSCPDGARVIIVDDLLATGGTAAGAGKLIRECGGEVVSYLFLIELKNLNGRSLLHPAQIHSLIEY